jgi:hypothetical protein
MDAKYEAPRSGRVDVVEQGWRRTFVTLASSRS